MIEKRFLPTGSAASRALLGSCDISEDSLHKPLALWSGIEHLCLSPFYKEWYLAKVCTCVRVRVCVCVCVCVGKGAAPHKGARV